MVEGYVNYVPATKGRVAAICCHCGRRSKPCRPNHCGEPDLFDMKGRWSEAPYPADFKHNDGSVGSTFTCPQCHVRLHAGERLKLRDYLPTISATSTRGNEP